MYKQRIELLLKSAIDEISFAIDTTKDVNSSAGFASIAANSHNYAR